MEDEIDVREYVLVIVRHWKVIAAVTLAAALVAFLVSSLLPRSYAATALVVVTSPRYILNFEPRIETANSENIQRVNPKTYLGLATSDELLRQLAADPATAPLEPEQRTLVALRDLLKAAAGADPTLMELQATDTDPAHAAAIANAWAKLFVKYVNQIYGYEQSAQALFGAQLMSAKADYEATQRVWEEFLGSNRIAELQREIGVRQSLIDSYQSELTASQAQPLTQELQTRRRRLTEAFNELVSLEQQQRQIIQDYYGQLAVIESLLADARALREQAQAGSVSSSANLGDALAQLLLRSRSLASAAGGNVQLQISLEQTVGQLPVSDVDSLIVVLESRRGVIQAQIEALLLISRGQMPDSTVTLDSRFGVLEARKAEAEARIESLTGGLMSGLTSAEGALSGDPVSRLIAQYSDEVLTLSADLEAEQARQRELVQARDLAWETYTTLARKADERRIAVQTGEAVVQLASAASIPTEPNGPRRLMNTVLAGAIGLMASLIAVFARNWWQGARLEAAPVIVSARG